MAAIVPDLNTVSGLAEGIDGVCHKTSIEVKIPTIAVMGRGLDAIYPVIHTNLAQQIVNNGGMLVSEYASGVTSMPTNFLARNRIIAGLSDATLVIESSARGGSLNTAAEALSYNRDVFALPGRANDEHSEGCNNLIKGGRALMITNAKDIVKEMGWKEKEKRQDKAVQTDLFPNISDEDKKIISLLHKSSSGMQTNEIAIALGVPVSKTSAQLMKMEFAGLVRCLPGNIYKLS